MSGAKVVRVKTRQERILEGEVLLARLHAAQARWESTADGTAIAETGSRVQALEKLLAWERFDELEQQAPREIAFLKADRERRREHKAAAQARQRARWRRLASTAASLLAALDDAGTAPPKDLSARLKAARGGLIDDLDAAEKAITDAIGLLAGSADDAAGREARVRLAARLAGGEATTTLADWLAERPPEDEAEASRVDEQIALLEVQAGAEAAATFVSRARAIAAEPGVGRRRLLTDSLLLDLSAALRHRQRSERLEDELDALGAELELHKDDAHAEVLLKQIREADRSDSEALEALCAKVTNWLAQQRSDAAARARREALLEALAALGYQVTEGMESAWVRHGRLVLKRSSSEDVGLEIGGNAGAGRLQLRAVGFESASGAWDHNRDKDAETLFCNDFARLREQVGSRDGELVLERAMPMGAQPLRTLAVNSNRKERVQVGSPPLSRRRDRSS